MYVCMFLQLEEVNWRQNLTMAQSGRSKLKQPNAFFEFVIKEGEVCCMGRSKGMLYGEK